MIINSSRAAEFLKCRRSAFNHYHRGIESAHRSMNLTDGGAAHEGVAVGLATKDWSAARESARAKFDTEVASSTILPEEAALAEDHWELIEVMIEEFRKGYENEKYQVIQPECEFDIPLPGSEHHCLFIHWSLAQAPEVIYPGPPPVEEILRGNVIRCACSACLTPHRIVGKTDALVAWNNNIWLLEHKTTAILGKNFWDQFLLDIQPTTYMYGIWRATGVRPSGFVLNAIFKPSEAQVASWNAKRKSGKLAAKDYVRFEREPFLRSEGDLLRVEKQYIEICDEWEDRIVSGRWTMSNIRTVCTAYNRLCDYHPMCCSHDAEPEIEALGLRTPDYVNDKLVKLQEERKGV